MHFCADGFLYCCCAECGGAGICDYGATINFCDGSSLCGHGKDKYFLKECDGRALYKTPHWLYYLAQLNRNRMADYEGFVTEKAPSWCAIYTMIHCLDNTLFGIGINSRRWSWSTQKSIHIGYEIFYSPSVVQVYRNRDIRNISSVQLTIV